MKRILLIDSDELFISQMCRYLQWHGYQVKVCVTADDPAVCAGDPWDLIMCSIYSRPINGFELCKNIQVKSSDNNPLTPFILMGPDTIGEDEYKRCIELNTSYFEKYASPETWISRIESVARYE